MLPIPVWTTTKLDVGHRLRARRDPRISPCVGVRAYPEPTSSRANVLLPTKRTGDTRRTWISEAMEHLHVS